MILTQPQRDALDLLRTYRGSGVYAAEGTCVIDGQPWINWRTAEALQRRGLVAVVTVGDGRSVHLIERDHPARWRHAVCPIHGFTVPRDHNLGWQRCSIPGCHLWHEVRDFFPEAEPA